MRKFVRFSLAILFVWALLLPLTALEITVGEGNQQGQIPVNLYYRTSLFETIFQSEEIGAAGLITGLKFYNNFADNIPNRPTMIWMGETHQTDLSGGWIVSSQLTEVFNGNVNYPAGQNTIHINLSSPYQYSGGNLVMMVFLPWEDEYFMSQNLFYTQTWGDSRSLFTYNHNVSINPDGPPVTGVMGSFPKTTFVINTSSTGSLYGEASDQVLPMQGVKISLGSVGNHRITDESGSYSFQYLLPGEHSVMAYKLGYEVQEQTVTISPGTPSQLNFSLLPLATVYLQGRVVGSDNPTLGISGATVTLGGYDTHSTTTDEMGIFVFFGLYANQAYTYSASAPGYQTLVGTVSPGAPGLYIGDLTLSEMAYAPVNVGAELLANEDSVQITWEDPVIAQEGWLHYDTGENYNAFGTGGSLSFDVAARFPADALVDYAGGYLQAVKFWPAMGGNYVVKVWRGGSATGPGVQAVNQPVIPVLNAWNTVLLDFPVPITGNEEIWIGFLCDVTGVNPAYAGFDEGPANNGYGNLIYWQGNWTTLLAVNSYLDFNWNLQGYAGLGAPSATPSELIPLGSARSEEREQIGYHVWRMLQSQVNNESAWIGVTDEPITGQIVIDPSWDNLPNGSYLWAVKTIYTGGVMSEAAFSNPLEKTVLVGTITGLVRNQASQPIPGAVVSCLGQSSTTNASGIYSLLVEVGTHSVTASHPNYQALTHENVEVTTEQPVLLHFVLQAVANAEDNAPAFVTTLRGNSPNPFRESTVISYSLKEAGEMSIEIYDLRGRLIHSYRQSVAEAGFGSYLWDGRDSLKQRVASGIYFYRMRTKDFEARRKMLILN